MIKSVILLLAIFADAVYMLTMNDSDVLSVYNNMFSKGENLIFLSYGSRSHHLSTVDAILDEIIMKDKFRHELLCVNVNEDSNVQNSFRNFNKNHGQSRRLFVVDGTEKLTREQLTRNNYLFSVKDPLAHSNVIVLITWDNQTVPLIEGCIIPHINAKKDFEIVW